MTPLDQNVLQTPRSATASPESESEQGDFATLISKQAGARRDIWCQGKSGFPLPDRHSIHGQSLQGDSRGSRIPGGVTVMCPSIITSLESGVPLLKGICLPGATLPLIRRLTTSCRKNNVRLKAVNERRGPSCPSKHQRTIVHGPRQSWRA